MKSQCFKAGQNSRTFDDNKQHDAAEFMNSLLEHLFEGANILKEDLFGGLCQKTMFCQCNQAEELQIEDISEVLPLELKGITLESCLENYFSPEEIERRCAHCQSQRSTQVTTFIRNPKTLIIQLNRFEFLQESNRSIKKSDNIIIPNTTELPDGTKYNLLSIINHHGDSPNSGHYTCLLPEASGDTFTLVDDATVTRSFRRTEELNIAGYILMYAKE